ncbi:MAG: DUF6476 family protein [Pseudomonadota bacterium]
MDGEEAPETGTLKYLKTLVTVLTLTMIAGVVTIVALLVIRFSDARTVTFPDEITLPDGVVATAFTQGQTWYAVVTEDDEILIYSRLTGALSQRIPITAE